MLAVLKADAYGQRAVRCAYALADLADGFAVAFLEEAVELRTQGITQPIVLLEACSMLPNTPPWTNTACGRWWPTNGSSKPC